MGGLFGGKSAPIIIPAPAPPPPTPMPDAEATLRAEKRKALKERQRRGGRAATILSEENADALGG